jgi:hypothetical protein
MGIDLKNKIKLDKKFFAEKTIITAKAGTGKSYLSRVLIEEGRKLGNSFVIIDPQDAYENLEGFEYVDIRDIKSSKKFGTLIALTNRNVVISVKSMTIDQQNKFLKFFLEGYRLNLQKGIHTIVIDEGHKFAPEYEKTQSKELLRGLVQENRSDGLGCFVISQRIQRLDKTIISQADNIACGKVTSHRDKEAIKNYIENPKDIDKLSKLERGEFYLLGFGIDDGSIHKIRKAESLHSGDTPKDLLIEDKDNYDIGSVAILKRNKYKTNDDKMTNNVLEKGKDMLNLPSGKNIRDFGIMGMQIGLGGILSGMISTGVSKITPDLNLPLVSNRTIASVVSSLIGFSLYKFVSPKMNILKTSLKYGTAGSFGFMFGSLILDTLGFMNINLPAPLMNILGETTGASVPDGSGQKVDSEPAQSSVVDLNTMFA